VPYTERVRERREYRDLGLREVRFEIVDDVERTEQVAERDRANDLDLAGPACLKAIWVTSRCLKERQPGGSWHP
jgi:hypothetical protein